MKVLIAGNMGYIGPVVSKHLNELGYKIYGLDTGFFDICTNTLYSSPDHHVNIQLRKDVREINEDDLSGIDHVIYLAAISNDPMGLEFESVTNIINHEFAVHCANIAKNVGVKSFVFASSCSVYGAAGDGIDRNESSPLNPVTIYAHSKINAENQLYDIADNQFRITCLRFATACGFSPRLRLDLVLNDFVYSAITKANIKILSDGSPWRPLIHITDMARALHWAIERDNSAGDFLALNVGDNSWNFQIKEIAARVAKLIPGTDVIVNKDAAPDKRSYKVNFDLFSKLAPNHKPIVSIEDAIVDIRDGINEYINNGYSFSKVNTIRLEKLRSLIQNNKVTSELHWV